MCPTHALRSVAQFRDAALEKNEERRTVCAMNAKGARSGSGLVAVSTRYGVGEREGKRHAPCDEPATMRDTNCRQCEVQWVRSVANSGVTESFGAMPAKQVRGLDDGRFPLGERFMLAATIPSEELR